jgi:hypothetical protein
MNQFTCQNLTTAISMIASKKTVINLAINRMQPHDGIIAKEEIIKILEPCHILATLGVATAKFLIEKLGSIEELQKRIIDVPIGGKSATQIAIELLNRNIRNYNTAGIDMKVKMYESKDFEKNSIKPARQIKTISLSTTEIGLNGKVSYEQIIERAKMLGLTLCPPEITPRLTLLDDYCPKDEYVVIAMKPMKDSLGYSSVLGIEKNHNNIAIAGYDVATLKLSPSPIVFIFQIPPHKQKKANKYK